MRTSLGSPGYALLFAEKLRFSDSHARYIAAVPPLGGIASVGWRLV